MSILAVIRFFSTQPASARALARRLAIVLISGWLISFGLLSLVNPSIVEAVGDDGQNHRFAAQPYELRTDRHDATLTFRLRYSSWQNATLQIEPQGGCINRVELTSLAAGVAMPAPTALDIAPFCHQGQLDLSSLLRDGLNQISLDIAINKADYTDHPDSTLIYITPQLFGTHTISTFACLLLFSAFAYALFMIARHTGLNIASAWLLLIAFAWFALTLHIKPNLAYSNDLPGHISYARYMIDGWWHPYGYEGWENFHPPLYYIVAGRFFGWSDASVLGPLNAMRMFSLFLYMTFCFFGLHTLHVATGRRNTAYYAGCLLILFWPIASIVATRISNDVAVYAAWSAAFYFLARFFEKRELSALQLAVGFTGLTFAIKTTGLAMLVTAVCCGIYALAARRLLWSDLLRGRSLAALGFLALGILCNTGKTIYLFFRGGNGEYLSLDAHEVHPAWYYLHLDIADYLTHPVVTFDREPGFLNYFLKTVLYSEQQLDGISALVPGLLNMLMLALIAVVAGLTVGTLRYGRGTGGRIFPYLAAVVIAPFEPYIFMLLKRYMFCQSFRFVLPMLVPFTVLFVRGLAFLPETVPARLFGTAANGLALALALGGLIATFWLYAQGQFG